VIADFLSTTRFGFMTMEREGAGWSMRAFDDDGRPMVSCTVAARRAACMPVTAASP
jgi:hypothetical protein